MCLTVIKAKGGYLKNLKYIFDLFNTFFGYYMIPYVLFHSSDVFTIILQIRKSPGMRRSLFDWYCIYTHTHTDCHTSTQAKKDTPGPTHTPSHPIRQSDLWFRQLPHQTAPFPLPNKHSLLHTSHSHTQHGRHFQTFSLHPKRHPIPYIGSVPKEVVHLDLGHKVEAELNQNKVKQ